KQHAQLQAEHQQLAGQKTMMAVASREEHAALAPVATGSTLAPASAARPRIGPLLPPSPQQRAEGLNGPSVPGDSSSPLRLAQSPTGTGATPTPHLAVVGAAPQEQSSRASRPGSLTIGSIAGIQIHLHVSWLIIVALLTTSLATSFFPQ